MRDEERTREIEKIERESKRRRGEERECELDPHKLGFLNSCKDRRKDGVF